MHHITKCLCPSRHVNDEYILSFSLAALGRFEKIDNLQVIRLVGHQTHHTKMEYNKKFDISVKYTKKLVNLIYKKNSKTIANKFSKIFLENFKKMVSKREKKKSTNYIIKLVFTGFYDLFRNIKKIIE